MRRRPGRGPSPPRWRRRCCANRNHPPGPSKRRRSLPARGEKSMQPPDNIETATMVVQRPDMFWREASAAEQYEAGRFSSVWGRVYRACEESAVGKALGMLEPRTTLLDAACGTG